MYLSITRLFGAVAALMLASSVWAADAGTIKGVVTNVNVERQTMTIRNDATGQRRTYFVGTDTRISAAGNAIELANIQKGNAVTLRYTATDTGRVINSLTIGDLDEIVEVIPVVMSEVMSLSGVVTGVRVTTRTLTIRDDATRERRTLKVPETASVTRDGNSLTLRDISPGDRITARYRITDRGLIMVTGRSPEVVEEPAEEAQAQPAELPAVLPKTAGQTFVLLYAGLFLLLLGGLTRLAVNRGR